MVLKLKFTMLKRIFSVCFLIICIQTLCFSQVFEYHPSLALSSGLSFSRQMASETSILLRNEFTLKDSRIGSFCPIVGIGYSNRAYFLQYHSADVDPFSGPVYMQSAVLEVSLLMRFTSWRKLRRIMIPYVGVNSFRFLSKSISQEEKQFFERVDPKYSEIVNGVRNPHTYFSIETGVELVRNGWPRLCMSIIWELPIPTKVGLGKPDSSFYFEHSSLYCPRIVVGLRL